MLKMSISCEVSKETNRLNLLRGGKTDREQDLQRAACAVRQRLVWLLNYVDECNIDSDVEMTVKVRKVAGP